MQLLLQLTTIGKYIVDPLFFHSSPLPGLAAGCKLERSAAARMFAYKGSAPTLLALSWVRHSILVLIVSTQPLFEIMMPNIPML